MTRFLTLPFWVLFLWAACGTPDTIRDPSSEGPRPSARPVEDVAAMKAVRREQVAKVRESVRSWDTFQNKAESRPLEPYLIDNGDLLKIEVYAQAPGTAFAEKLGELAGEYTVTGDGTIALPYQGNISVRRKTLDELEALLEGKLAEMYQQPNVAVSLKTPRQRLVTVNGFPKSGRVPIDPRSTVLDVLTIAGWDLQSSPIRAVLVIRGGTELTQINLQEVTEDFQLRYNIRLRDGDIIIPAPSAAPVRVTGEVRKQGAIVPVSEHGFISVARALSAADGVSAEANLDIVRILRADGAEELINLQDALFGPPDQPQPVLFSGDHLFVPSKSGMGFYVFGEVETQGFFEMEADADILKALARASVSDFASDLSQVVLVRSKGNAAPEIYNIRADDLLAGDQSQNMSVRNGDVVYVPKTGTAITLDFINRLLSPLSGSASFGLQVQQGARDARQ